MKPRLGSRLLLSLLVAACATVVACSSDPEAPADLPARLETDTGTKWVVYTDPRSLEVRFLAPVEPVAIGEGSPEEKARAFFERYRSELHGTGKRDELRLVDTTVDDDGATHLRFEHVLPGTELPVFDVATTAHFVANGGAYWMQPGFRADLAGVSPTARISREAAIRTAIDHLVATCGPLDEPPELLSVEVGVHAQEGAPAALAHRVRAATESPRCIAPEVLVDALSGAVLATHERASSLWDTSAGARFHLLGDQRDKKTIDVERSLFGSYSLKSQMSPSVETLQYVQFARKFELRPYSTDKLGAWDTEHKYKGAAVSAHFHGFHALRFFKEAQLKSEGITKVTLVVHANSPRT
ncbi:MAG: hypothetical protein KF819_36620, partial [Labilithrix sp.]|nr:hypothetical protein [Labilithrix sp.]